MSKCALPVLLILLGIILVAGDDGVNAACRKAHDAKFCMSFLQPYASQLLNADGLMTAKVVMNATLERVNDLRKYMVHDAVQNQTTPEELETFSNCLSNVGNGEGALKVALETLNETKGVDRDELLHIIHTATIQLTVCVDSLKKHVQDDVIRKALSLTEDSIRACSVAQTALP